jgi:outer membrane protein assembly factor BamB
MAGCVDTVVDSLGGGCSEGALTEGPASASGEGRWAGYGSGPENDAATFASGPDDPELAWRYATCDTLLDRCSPLLADGRVFVSHRKDGGTRALDASTGEQLWTSEATGPSVGQAYADGTLYAANGDLFAFDGADGSVEWRFTPVPEEGPEEGPGDVSPNVHAPAVAEDGTVFVAAVAEAIWQFALDAANGSRLWERRLADSRLPFVTAVGPEAVFAVGTETELLALDRETGEVRWTREFENRVAAAAVAGDRLYVTTDGVLHALSLDGRPRYTIPTGVQPWPVAADGERLYVTDRTLILAAFDAETGEKLWRAEDVSEPGKPVVGESTVYVGDVEFPDDGSPQAVIHAVDKATGDSEWQFETRGRSGEDDRRYFGTKEQIAVGDGTLYATTGAGDLYAVADR